MDYTILRALPHGIIPFYSSYNINMKDLWKRIAHLPFGLKDHIVGSPQTKADKARTAHQLKIEVASRLEKGSAIPTMAAAEEFLHAKSLPGRVDIGFTTNLFGTVTRAFVRSTDQHTPEQIYLSALAGVNKKTGRVKMVGTMEVEETMHSQGDIDAAARAAKLLTDEQVHSLNKQIFPYYKPRDLEILGFDTLTTKRSGRK